MAKFDNIKKLADSMIEVDRGRNKAFRAYQLMYQNMWDLPSEIKKLGYVTKSVATDPHDAIAAGVRVMSSIRPDITITPPLPTVEQKRKANADERNLQWHLHTADRRRGRGVVADVMQSALLYDAVALNVIDLEWQIEQARALKANTKRMEAAKKICRYVINVYNPQAVHVRRSSYGNEAVLLHQRRYASEIMDEWGDAGKRMSRMAEQNEIVEYYDFTNYDERCVWVGNGGADYATLMWPQVQKHDLTFLPWAAVMGGSSLEDLPEHQYHPMLYPLYMAGTWDIMNILMSMNATESIFKTFRPELAESGPSETGTVDYTDPSMVYKTGVGNTLQQLVKQGLDPAKITFLEQLKRQLEQSTISQVLMGGSLPSGTAFSTLNLATQTAVGALKPPRDLAEKALAEMFVLMLQWTAKSGKPMVGYGMGRRDKGKMYTIQPDEIDTEQINLTVSLKPDVPTDRLQKANTAIMMARELHYPIEKALEEMGVEDPETIIRLWYLEKLKDHKFQMRLEEERMALQMQAQQEMMDQQAALAEEQAAAEEEESMIGGQGFNPAMGGQPPIQANPDILREQMAGMDFAGNPLAEGMGM